MPTNNSNNNNNNNNNIGNALNYNVHKGTINRLTNFEKTYFEKSTPTVSAKQVSRFLNYCTRISGGTSIAEQLYFSPRDGSICLSHQSGNDHFNLITVLQDYTANCESTFVNGWKGATNAVGDPSLISKFLSNASPVQNFLLRKVVSPTPPANNSNPSSNSPASNSNPPSNGNRDPPPKESDFPHPAAFLNFIRRDPHPEEPNHTVYTVETAYSYKAIPTDEHLPDLYLSYFPYAPIYSLVRASRSQITLWAMLHLVPVDATENSDAKLLRDERIKITKEIISLASNSSTSTVTAYPLNSYQFLKSRHKHWHTGRLRYPLLRARMESRQLLNRNDIIQGSGGKPDSSVPSNSDDPVVTEFSNIPLILAIIFFTALCASFGFFYLFRLKSPRDNEDVIAISVAIFVALLPIFFALFAFIFTRQCSPDRVFQVRRKLTAEQVMEKAGEKQIKAITTEPCLEHYSATNLSWTGKEYTGSVTWEKRWKVSDLVKFRYKMAYCCDGCEALITPDGVQLRLIEVRRNTENNKYEARFARIFTLDDRQKWAVDERERRQLREKELEEGIWSGGDAKWVADVYCI